MCYANDDLPSNYRIIAHAITLHLGGYRIAPLLKTAMLTPHAGDNNFTRESASLLSFPFHMFCWPLWENAPMSIHYRPSRFQPCQEMRYTWF